MQIEESLDVFLIDLGSWKASSHALPSRSSRIASHRPWFFINISGSTKSLHFEDAVYIIWECKILSEGTKILDG